MKKKIIIVLLVIILAMIVACSTFLVSGIVDNILSDRNDTVVENTEEVSVQQPAESTEAQNAIEEPPADSVPTQTPAEEPTANTESEYVTLLQNEAGKVSGEIQYGLHMFEKGIKYMTPSKSVPSASVIKVFIMEYAYDLMGSGVITPDSLVNGTTVNDLIYAMITRSDNDATNALIDHFGMNYMNAFFERQGYLETRLERKMLDYDALNAGLDNYTSVRDVMMFLEKLYNNRDAYPYSQMLDIMKQQKVRTKIPRNMPGSAVIANKTGELSNVENDIGIVFTQKGDFAVVFLCSSLTSTASARDFISNSSVLLYNKLINE